MGDEGSPNDARPDDASDMAPRPSLRRDLIEAVVCSGYPTQLALGGLLRAVGLSPLMPDGRLSAVFVFLVSLLDTVVLVGLMLGFMAARNESAGARFFGERPALREAAFGLTTVPFVLVIVASVSVAIRTLAPALHNVPTNPLETMLGTQAGLPVFLFVVVVAGGLREELQRAFLLSRLGPALGDDRLALVLTSASFGLGHTIQGLDAALITALLGALWGVLYLARRSVVAGIVSHSVFNSSQLLFVALR